MHKEFSCVEMYKVVLYFLNIIYYQAKDEFLGDMLSGAALYSVIPGKEPETMDPAVFDDWMLCVRAEIQNDVSVFDSITLTSLQGYAIMHRYFVFYCDLGAQSSIITLRDLLGTDIEQSIIAQWLWKKWMDSITAIEQGQDFKDGAYLFNAKTALAHLQSSKVMSIFLDNFCQHTPDPQLIALVQSCRLKSSDSYGLASTSIDPEVWEMWRVALEYTQKKRQGEEIHLVVAYCVMPYFVICSFEDNWSKKIYDMIGKFALYEDEDETPVVMSYWDEWINAAVQLNAQEVEYEQGIISINTPLMISVAFRIVEAWFAIHGSLVGSDCAERIKKNPILWQQAVERVQKRQRSYLLASDELTVLEVYHCMLGLLESAGCSVPAFEIDEAQKNKPKDFTILLQWIMCAQEVAMSKTS